MKKTISAILLMLIFCISLSMSAFAEESEATYIVDGVGMLSDDELDDLNEYGAYLSDVTGTDILFVYAFTEDLDDYVSQALLDKGNDLILMIETDEYWDMYLSGTAEHIISDDDMEELRAAYSQETESYDGIAAYMYAAAQLVQPDAVSGSGAESTITLDTKSRLEDMAELLSDSEKTALLAKLDEISERQQADIVVVTVDTLDGMTPMEYADDFYDYFGYGFGENNDGVLLLISMEDRDWWITTTGYGITAITDAGIEYISEKFLSDLSDGEYAEAFTTYAELCDEFFTQAKTGEPYDVGHMPKEPFNFAWCLAGALVVGYVVAAIVTGRMKRQLETVRFQSAAGNYIKENSMNVAESRDLFLYTHVDRRLKPKETSSSGGSSTHTSSSGTTHGGGGGKF